MAFSFLFQRDNKFLAVDIVNYLHKTALLWPYDIESVSFDGNIAAIQTIQYGSTKDKWIKLPYTFTINERKILFVGDVRLDNRIELMKELSLSPNEEYTDAVLIVHSYLKWGNVCGKYLLGDFSFALYDYTLQSLLCMRDHMGVRPLYYYQNDSLFIVSDTIDIILAHPSVSQALNNTVVAEWCMTAHVFNTFETFYKEIYKCPRAMYLSITQTTIQKQEYWNINEIVPLDYEGEHKYVEHLQLLLKQVVKDRIDISYPIAAHSSGGLDSSVISVIANRICKKQDKLFYTYNWCKEKDNSNLHEWADARKLADLEDFIHEEIELDKNAIEQYLLHHNIALHGTTMFEYERSVLEKSKAQGVRAILSGFGGDEILTSRSKNNYRDKIYKGQFFHVYKRLLSEVKIDKFHHLKVFKRFMGELFRSLLSEQYLTKDKRKEVERRVGVKKKLLNKEFAKFITENKPIEPLIFYGSIHEQQRQAIDSGYHQERMETWAVIGREYGVRYLYPYLDKRIVEFSLSIPEHLYYKDGQTRYLYRQASQDLLPEFLHNKGKPLESNRVKDLIKIECKILSELKVTQMNTDSSLSYVNKVRLQEKIDGFIYNMDNDLLNTSDSIHEFIAIRTMLLAIQLK